LAEAGINFAAFAVRLEATPLQNNLKLLHNRVDIPGGESGMLSRRLTSRRRYYVLNCNLVARVCGVCISMIVAPSGAHAHAEKDALPFAFYQFIFHEFKFR
jgi:hypothetical protein